MSYRHRVENWLGEAEYITVETPDEDYDRMKQEEADMNNTETPVTGLKRYPEFRNLVDEIASDAIGRINAGVQLIKSEMPYKSQFVLEELISRLQKSV